MKQLRLYTDLAKWFHLLTAPEDYKEEAAFYTSLINSHSRIPVKTILEMGSGGGNNACHMKKDFRLTLSDLSQDMLDVSRRLNPECEHIQGDMRNLKLGRQYDAVFVHDAIDYILSEDDLLKTFKTAHAHLNKGGVALFCPDFMEETFKESTETGGHDAGSTEDKRGLRYLDWTWRPEGAVNHWISHFVIILRTGDKAEYLTDEHKCGLFPQKTWLELMEKAGFKDTKAAPYPENLKECVTPVIVGVKE